MKRSNLICYKKSFCVCVVLFFTLTSVQMLMLQKTPIKFKIFQMHSVSEKVRMKLMNDMVRCTFKLRSRASKATDDLFMP